MPNPKLSRRHFLAGTAAGASFAAVPAGSSAAPARPAVLPSDIRWLDGAAPAAHEGQSWGYPWPRGTKYSTRGYQMADGNGAVPMQTWPLAWWPDGSIKWTGHAIPANVGSGRLDLREGRGSMPSQAVSVRESVSGIEVSAGGVLWQIGRSGSAILRSARNGSRETLRNVSLIATAQDKPDNESGASAVQSFTSEIGAATVEQRGPVRAVVRVEGMHKGASQSWLPFTARLYFHAGSQSVRIVHSFIFDGDPANSFIRGLGLTGEVPMTDQPHDRHVRFAGQDGGLWAEAVRPLTGLRRDPGRPFRDAQIAGVAIPSTEGMPLNVQRELQYIPAWGDFTLSQPNSDGFAITKRTKPGHGWIDVDTAGRAPGFGFVGGPSGGVGFGMANFWQLNPTRLDIRNAATDVANFTIWYHSPSAPAMDLRMYHDGLGMDSYYEQNLGLDITYEDYEPGYGTAHGVARTIEFRLWAVPATPTRERLVQMAATVSKPARLIAGSKRIHDAGMFGIWSFPNTSTATLARIEERAKADLDYYLSQIEQRRWYGFWNYGDVMHSYDRDRHVWKYDIGGFAWDNSELSTDLWLWYSYLRTGRGDVFRMAEAMTRHTGEVDVYHLGRFKGLGTRHGVQHWGDSSKQQRISNAAYRRIYYYLTGDERVGDLMRALNDSDRALLNVQIERKVPFVSNPPRPVPPPLPAGQVNMSFGTVWGSLIAAWLTEWERTRDTRWRDRILAGMDSIGALPKQWFQGSAPYDLASGRFVGGSDRVALSHLNGAFGVFEMHAELFELLDVPPAYREAWLDYCQYYNAPPAEFEAKTGERGDANRGLRQGHSRFTAYAAIKRRDPALAQRAWKEFLGAGDSSTDRLNPPIRRVAGAAVLKPIDEIPERSTNDAAQWGLSAMQNIAMIGSVIGR
ncbi:MAG: Tat pathway signal sequence domain protein [Sphingomicrobium sp.]